MSLRFLPVWQKWHWKLGLKSTLVDITQRAAIFENLQPCLIGAALKGPIMWLPSLEEWCFWLIEIRWPNLMSISLIVHRSVECGWLRWRCSWTEARYCYSRHRMDIEGDSVSVTKRCVALEDCLSTGCSGTDHEGNKVSRRRAKERWRELRRDTPTVCCGICLTAKEIPNEQIHHLNICAI